MINITSYNENNIFAKILKKELPSEIVYEDENIVAFKDIAPQAPIHILVIPKEKFCSFNDFIEKAKKESIAKFMKSLKTVTEVLKLEDGYRLITNVGKIGGQEVPHLHFHILAGKNMGRLTSLD
tara:strand:- start:2350 stop:2721 length:372 start_codon:yes stop_codon:yes gene_type:complete